MSNFRQKLVDSNFLVPTTGRLRFDHQGAWQEYMFPGSAAGEGSVPFHQPPVQPPRIKTEFDDAVYGNSNGNDNGGYYYPNATGHDGSTAGMVSPVPTLSPSSPLAMSYALDQRTKKSNKKLSPMKPTGVTKRSSPTKQSSPTKPRNGNPSSTKNAVSRAEMEMYFERVTAAIPSAEWNKLVADVNAAFGMNRRPDNVKNHWNTKAKGCLLSGYQCQE